MEAPAPAATTGSFERTHTYRDDGTYTINAPSTLSRRDATRV